MKKIFFAVLAAAFFCPLEVSAVFLDAHLDPGGTEPQGGGYGSPGTAPMMKKFTATYTGELVSIDLHGVHGNFFYTPKMNLYEHDAQSGYSKAANVPSQTWAPFEFYPGTVIQAGHEYMFMLRMDREDDMVYSDLNWDYLASHATTWVDAVAFRVWLSPLNTIPGDVNADSTVDLTDFDMLKADFGTTRFPGPADLNQDGQVGLSDFGILKANFGKSATRTHVPEPSGWALAALGTLTLAHAKRSRHRTKSELT